MTSLLAYLVFNGYPERRRNVTLLVIVLCALPLWRGLGRASAPVVRFLSRPGRPELATFIFAFIVTAALASQRGIPQPYVHDEFSYLLAADTFAHGRLANPTPPAWEHFESMHILVRPTYQSKYPPGQGLFMALGQALCGNPIWGVWLSAGLAAAAMCWMLRAFVPPRWALLGAVLTAMHPQMLEWGQRYWGGSVATLGGALLVGGVGRILRRPGASAGFWAAVGVLIVGNTRPYEGLALTLIIGAGLTIFLARRGRLGATLRQSIVPALLVFIPGAIWMGYYNWHVTGHVLRLPYVEHHAQYGKAPLFLFQPMPSSKEYNHRELEKFAGDQVPDYQRRNSWRSLLRFAWEKVIWGLPATAFGNVSVLAIPLALLPWLLLRHQRVRWLSVILIVFAIPLLAETYMYGHYAAPGAALIAALVVMSLRHLHRLWRPYGPLAVRLVVVVTLLWSTFWWLAFHGWMQGGGYTSQRTAIVDEFMQKPGQHLLIVHYGPDHNVHDEWVYNGADISGAKVLFARDMGTEHNRDLLAAFPRHTAWLVEPENHGRLSLYEPDPVRP